MPSTKEKKMKSAKLSGKKERSMEEEDEEDIEDQEAGSESEDDAGSKRKRQGGKTGGKPSKKAKVGEEVLVSENTLDFLRDLSDHNDRDWFRENKDRYDKAKAEMDRLARFVYQKTREFDPTLKDEDGAKMVFRIYRDVRFGGLPYKTHFAAGFGDTGRKGESG
ncbi:hypothetical protein HDU93_009139 [Gonapodya sp. JEL0774]|nr:hypothetical protein HDU93_009139 [Gonapodya sp. JEL0774]